MDVIALSADCLKLKIKKTSIIVNPVPGISKTEADVILGLGKIDTTRVNNTRLIIGGVGEYEVGGLKISAESLTNGLIYSFSLDSKNVALVKASVLTNAVTDNIRDYDIVILEADEAVNQSAITAMEPRIIIVYGKLSKEIAKELGNIQDTSSKISVNEEKLPEETAVYLLS